MVVTATTIAAAAQPQFTANVKLVTVPVTVHATDRRVAVRPLEANNFRVYEDGREQRIVVFERDRRPVSLAIVLDVSTSMAGLPQKLAADTARTIFTALDPDDEVALMVFADWPVLVIPWSRVGTLPGIDWAQWVLPWDTALLDAVLAAIKLADTSTHRRVVVVAISDGFENASNRPLSDLVKTRQQSELEIYAMVVNPVVGPPGQVTHPVLSPRKATVAPRNYMGDIVGASGGLMFNVPSNDFMHAAVLTLKSDLQSQYVIGYETSRPLDGSYRRIKVEPTTRDLQVRHRGGYLARAMTP